MMILDSVKTYNNFSLKEYTTLKIGGEAEIAYFPSSIEEMIAIRNHLNSKNKRITVIGAGSNLLISSDGISGGVILTGNLSSCEFLADNRIKAYSGLKSSRFAQLLYENSLSGLEFLIGIPGTIGGAVTMNSSAHGQAIEQVIESVEVLNLETGELLNLDKFELDLGYRYSFVESNRHLILSATFKLQKDHPEKIMEKMEFHLNWRKQKHPPLTQPNAGSTFRNPEEGVYVGRLFEKLGAKNWVEGGAKISDIHANFLINTGSATSTDVSRLMHKMYNAVKKNFGYDLIAEIRYVGDASEEEEKIWKSFQVH